MDNEKIIAAIREGNTALGIELGSTRIKAVLVDENHNPIALGGHDWENRYENGIWTYGITDIWEGVQDSYQKMAEEVKEKYGVTLTSIGAIGFSAMMHGYMAFDKNGDLLVPFRTWRNTMTEEAASRLTELFSFHIPQRWSIAHLYQAILNGESHVSKIDYLITLEGYVHWKLTGKRVLGIGDCAGMFPVDSDTKDFNERMIHQFDKLVSDRKLPWRLRDIMPGVLTAGEEAGTLTKEGAALLDVSGNLKPGIPLCPPEGDAGTGMTATNSVAKRTGNVSAGTSVFAMVVLEKELSRVYEELDLVTTPAGDPVAMVHCNNCTSDLNSWVSLFEEFAETMGMKPDKNELFTALYRKALEGDKDGGGLLSFGYLSGEHITHFEEGRPLFVRTPNSRFNLANFMRVHLYTALGALHIGMDILFKEGVKLDVLLGHGGLFKTRETGQRIMAAAVGVPVSVMETAGEGGAWGAALLASYLIRKKEGESLDQYLSDHVFQDMAGETMEPDPEDITGFDAFMERYKDGLAIERAAVDCLHA
ncbi:FGGY-family carbohydrate kinase [Clostridium boliviensis]|uniref:FGGY-family carbohydrate kinase n=1 Tax=Clostridium boliviensis TaxID=318465 RepID=A0ABU4GKR8_9CLOT|nr:FGGY-family carbohydrate kinase [Clostridium boliviensis]MDW2798204.1 FGGY-family carbohydrate kinase [Clostridium boliviensis]